MQTSNIEPKVSAKIFTKFVNISSKWEGVINQSLLSDNMKELYRAVIGERIERVRY